MDALIDVNVILNFILEREDPFMESSKKILDLSTNNKFKGYVAFHSLPVVWYALRKHTPEEQRFWLKAICRLFEVVSITHEQVVEAVYNKSFKDFEDCLQDECAQNAGADFLVTCNVKDFLDAKTKICNPDEFVRMF